MGIERMKNRFIRHVLILLLCGFCHTAAFAYGYDRNDQSESWGYQPVYNSSSVAMPNYQFRTTSVLIPARDQSESVAWMPGNSRPRRVGEWPGEDDDPTGVVPDPVVPVGDAPWLFLLLLIAGYLAYRLHLKKRSPHLL